ncbi:hypothetical protein CTAYLR_002105 [Chrysophaeum taylorii]|uniref:Cytochrome b5 domain-containing protein 1 n=1 Tax=Chrysophaeum taylorii TaxID=2483200 RepID=A0AAD7XR81_9STRA|nr:hypothetical protein CTAYLR_002105 [Chrysophaeum taylorii]
MTLLPKQHGFRRRYYTRAEIAAHNSGDDAWVSIDGNVFDLTELIAANRGTLTQPLVANAGKDLSHWFRNGQVKTYYDEIFVPTRQFLHVREGPATPWWQDEQLVVGKVGKSRKVRVVNTLTHQADVLEVCSEETLAEIQTRYVEYNAHATSYTWKQLARDSFRPMDMAKTLDEAGLKDPDLHHLNVDPDDYIPTLHVYFNDDLSEK